MGLGKHADLEPLSEHLLPVGDWPTAQAGSPRQAAVLVPLIAGEHGTQVLLTERAVDLPHHAGQISFPGGQREAADADPRATALREAEEEVGLDPTLVSVAGGLDSYVTGTGFVITPIIGLLETLPDLRLDRQEVNAAFAAPLAFFMDERNRGHRDAAWQGRRHRYFEYRYRHYRVWGATAQILVNLCKKLQN